MQDKKPFITIITPTYNRANLISHAIESIINQKQDIPFDWEILIIDDGSTDDTKEIVNKYIKKYPKNIFYFYQKNSGIPGVARNVWLDNMNKNSDYTIFLDSDDELVDDCICVCLKQWEVLKKQNKYENIMWLVYFCKTQYGKLIGKKNLLKWHKDIDYTYRMYLSGKISWEMHCMLNSNLFFNNTVFRFEKDIVNESVLWSKLRKYGHQNSKQFLILNYIWRIYRIEENSNQITKSINPEKFRKNAIGNERIIDIIWSDLLKFWYKKSYAEYLFKWGINWILYWEKKKGLSCLYKSLRYRFSFKILALYILSFLSRNIVLFIYKVYI